MEMDVGIRNARDLRKIGGQASGSSLKNPLDTQQAVLNILSVNKFYIDQSGGTGGTYGVLVGARNGVNTVFTVSQGNYVSGALGVFLNGQMLTRGTAEDWHEANPATGTFHFSVAPDATDELTAIYGYMGVGAGVSATKARTFTWVVDAPVVGGIPGPRLQGTYTVTNINCFIVGGTSVTFDIEERNVIGTPGTDITAASIVADDVGVEVITFVNPSLAAGNWLWLYISGVDGAVTKFAVTLSVVD